jgi:hypothetical protein
MAYIFLYSCCYSFKGISIPDEVSTYYVENFINRVSDAPIGIDVRFSEALRAKVRNESRLKYTEIDPDVQFSGVIMGYFISYEAPQEGNTVALNKLTITIEVEFKNNKKEEEKKTKTYSFFRTFDRSANLTDIQDSLIKEIFDQMVEAIFNDSFADW